MKRVLVAALAVMATASIASAQLLTQMGPMQANKADAPAGQDYSHLDNPEAGLICNFNVAGIQSWDAYQDPNNTIVVLDVAACVGLASGTSIAMNGIGWDVTLTALGGSWQSELRVYFDDNINPDGTGLFLRPGAGTNTPGTGTFSNPVIKLPDVQIPIIPLPNGMLRLDFHESFDDVNDQVDGTWDSGFLRIQVTPEPSTLALLGLGALGLIRRRR